MTQQQQRRTVTSIALFAALGIAATALVLAPSWWPHEVSAAPKDQSQSCLLKVNKGFASIASAQNEVVALCFDAAAAGTLGAQTLEECTLADNEGVLGAALDEYYADIGGCVPDPVSDPTATAQAAIDASLALVHDALATDLDALVLSSNEAQLNCQKKVSTLASKCWAAKLKLFNECKKSLFKGGATVMPADLEACLGPDPDGTIEKACFTKMAKDINQHCSGVDTSVAVPACETPDLAELATCTDTTVECALCEALNQLDGLSTSCDEFDDGEVNNSCGLDACQTCRALVSAGREDLDCDLFDDELRNGSCLLLTEGCDDASAEEYLAEFGEDSTFTFMMDTAAFLGFEPALGFPVVCQSEGDLVSFEATLLRPGDPDSLRVISSLEFPASSSTILIHGHESSVDLFLPDGVVRFDFSLNPESPSLLPLDLEDLQLPLEAAASAVEERVGIAEASSANSEEDCDVSLNCLARALASCEPPRVLRRLRYVSPTSVVGASWL